MIQAVVIYISRRTKRHADVAQSVERILGKDEVTGSNPVISSEGLAELQVLFLLSPPFLTIQTPRGIISHDLAAFFCVFVINVVSFFLSDY